MKIVVVLANANGRNETSVGNGCVRGEVSESTSYFNLTGRFDECFQL